MLHKLLSKIPILQFQESSPPKTIHSTTNNNNNNYYSNYSHHNNDNNNNNYNYFVSSILQPKLLTSRSAATRNSIISVDSYYSASSIKDEEEIKESIPMTTICVEQEIHRVASGILQQCIDLLRSLPTDESFVYESKHVPSSTIGKHVR